MAEKSRPIANGIADGSLNVMFVSVIIPAYNEEQALPLVLQELPRDRVSEVIVVDNGSTDRTFFVAQTANVKVVFEPRRGYGSACQAGLRALSTDSEAIVFLDGDHSDYPEELPTLLEPIERGEADLVIGSRLLGQAEPGSLPLQQRFGNWLACSLIALRFGRRFTPPLWSSRGERFVAGRIPDDPSWSLRRSDRAKGVGFTDLGPFRAIRRDALERLALRDQGFGWNVEMQLKALKANLRIVEVPVRYRKRIGYSKISGTITGTIRAGLGILGMIARH